MKETKVVKYWKSLDKPDVDHLALLLENFGIQFSYHSGNIENDKITYFDTREVFENGKVVNYTGDLRTLFEIENLKRCYEEILPKVIKKEPITVPFIKRINKLLCDNTLDERRYIINGERPGEFKKHDYVVGKNEVGSTPGEVENDIAALVSEMNEYAGEEILTAASYFHCRFENIHPFSDGNGRTGRMLLNYYLMINDYPPVIINTEDKRNYYDALNEYDEKEDIYSMLSFLETQLDKTWEKSIERAEICLEHQPFEM